MTKHLLDLHRVDEMKNFAADNLLSWCLKSHTGIRTTVNHVLGSHASEKGTVITEQVQLGIGVRVHVTTQGKALATFALYFKRTSHN